MEMAEKSTKVEEKSQASPTDASVKDVRKPRVPDPTDIVEQERALQNYKVTGVVGDFVDPTRDQEWDIAPEFGVHPHPELHNVAPPNEGFGLGQPAPVNQTSGLRGFGAEKALPVDEKDKRAKELDKQTGDEPVSARLAAGRPDLRGNETVVAANEEAKKDSDKKDSK